ncbi:MAG: hypothetical protein U9R24_00800 [Thermodesulfobacteriota bacterium]|nr:hypothetical protein [Thermodesulfobacteriota bacterium]
MIKFSNRNDRIKLLSILCILFLVCIQGCAGINENMAMFFERPAIEKAVCRYFDAEIKRDLKKVYECLATSSIYRSTHTYGEYLEQAQDSPVRIKDYHILNIHDLRGNHDKVKYPKIEKFVSVEVDITLLYDDSNETMEVNQDFTFIKEGGKWYKG